MIRSDLPRRRGRRPSARFPIRRTVVERGLAREKVLEAGTRVRCLRCGSCFLADQNTVRLGELEIDDTPIVRCPCCGYEASVLYYFDRAVDEDGKPKRRRYRTPESAGPVALIETPEG